MPKNVAAGVEAPVLPEPTPIRPTVAPLKNEAAYSEKLERTFRNRFATSLTAVSYEEGLALGEHLVGLTRDVIQRVVADILSE